MAIIETWFEQDLKRPVKINKLDGNVFSQDNEGNLIGVELFDNGEPAIISGTVSGTVIRADGGTVAISSGTLSGNKCSVILPSTAYAVPGLISVVIKLTSGGRITTVCAVVAMCYRSSTDIAIDPGTIIPSIEDLIEQINEAIQSIPPNYSNLTNAVQIIENGAVQKSLSWEQGGVDGDTGAFVTSSIQIRTGFLYVGKGNTVRLTTTNGYRTHTRWYNGTDAALYVGGANSVSGYISAPADYLVLLCTSPSWGNIVPSEGTNAACRIIARQEYLDGSVRQAWILSSVPIELDTSTWKLKLSTNNYCRIITSLGEKVNLNGIGEVSLSSSCVLYYKRSTNEFITTDYTENITGNDLYFVGCTNGIQVIHMNILSFFSVNGLVSTGDTPQYDFFYNYRYGPSYLAVLGDSISTYTDYSEGAYYPTGDVDTVNEMWWSIVARGLRIQNADVAVSAISRTAFIDQGDASLPPAYDDTRITRLGSKGYPSYIFVNMGTNDPFLNNIGAMTYETDISALNALPNSTTKGIALTIRKIQEAYADARIVILIPKQVKIDTVHQTSPQYTSELVEKVAERIKELGDLYGVFAVIDLRKCDINQKNVASYCGDGSIHPNALGMKRIGDYILHELLR